MAKTENQKFKKKVDKAVKWAEKQGQTAVLEPDEVIPKSGAGRPTKYKVEYNQVVKSLCMKGATDLELCEALQIAEQTLNTWKKEHPKFMESIKQGKALIDSVVEKSLFNRAVGCSIKETKVFCQEGEIITHDMERHFPPDPASMIFWLKNRQPKLWRDKQEVDLLTNFNITMSKADADTL